jgi:biopolymer transport protein ExbD
MAEIDASGGGKNKGGKKRSKKQSTKVDMTPMVDLGFLLITFFMLTTTFSKPQSMDVVMPDKTKDQTKQSQDVKASHTISMVLGDDNKVYWWQGIKEKGVDPVVTSTDYSPNGIRKVLLQKVGEIPKLVVIIKAKKKAKYKNVVDILDEMTICEVPTYAIVDISPDDIKLADSKK